MANNGWRALIYDAEWARFKKGQEGVIVSEDGRMCETIDDNRDNILIEADPNFNFMPRTSGHILFRQKGTDLYDIVCLEQEAGGSLELLITKDVEMNVCNGSSDYKKITEELDNQNLVVLKINEESKSIKSCHNCDEMEGECYCLIKPTYEEFSNAISELSESNEESKSLDLVIATRQFNDIYTSTEVNAKKVILKSPRTETRGNEESVFDLSNLTVTTGSTEEEPTYTVNCKITPSNAVASDCNPGSIQFSVIETTSNCDCKIIKSPNVSEIPCNGGNRTLYFAIACSGEESDVYYEIDFGNCSVQTKYDIKTCFDTKTYYEEGSITGFSLNETDTVRLVQGGEGNVLRFIVGLNDTTFSVKVKSNLGFSCNAIFVKDNNGDFKINNTSCTSSTP